MDTKSVNLIIKAFKAGFNCNGAYSDSLEKFLQDNKIGFVIVLMQGDNVYYLESFDINSFGLLENCEWTNHKEDAFLFFCQELAEEINMLIFNNQNNKTSVCVYQNA